MNHILQVPASAPCLTKFLKDSCFSLLDTFTVFPSLPLKTLELDLNNTGETKPNLTKLILTSA